MTGERHVDVLIIGAGISGIDVAAHLIREQTGRSFAILERRDAIGGTWDLFRYPGIRSDSDMYTFGYGFRPWHGTKVLADGRRIREYVADTADEYRITDRIRFGRKVVRASWSSDQALWTVTAIDEASGETETWTSSFLAGCTGYYDYDRGYRPEFPGEADFAGRLVHPQSWPEDLDYRGQQVVVIGSGATAITLVPAMAPDAAHVTMLQRSPTYIASLPETDPVSQGLRRAKLPRRAVYELGRARNIAIQQGFYKLARSQPDLARNLLLRLVRRQVGSNIDMRHFTPTYQPWDERLCVVPNGDLFKALRSGKASIVTDRIATFTRDGIRLESGEELPADIVVTATGLNIQVLGGMALEVDGQPVTTRDTAVYKGTLLSGVPNAMLVIGYTNASWTLKADLAASYFCRVLNLMRDKGFDRFEAIIEPADLTEDSIMGGTLSSGYIQRGDAVMPRQGRRGPWKALNDYLRDVGYLRRSPIEDGVLEFSKTGPAGRRSVA